MDEVLAEGNLTYFYASTFVKQNLGKKNENKTTKKKSSCSAIKREPSSFMSVLFFTEFRSIVNARNKKYKRRKRETR